MRLITMCVEQHKNNHWAKQIRPLGFPLILTEAKIVRITTSIITQRTQIGLEHGRNLLLANANPSVQSNSIGKYATLQKLLQQVNYHIHMPNLTKPAV